MAKKTKIAKPMSRCTTRSCSNDPAEGRRYCHKCRQRRFREKNPIAAAWFSLLDHARERGIAVEMTRQEFNVWCEQTDYHNKRGNDEGDLTIDRKDPSGPYSINNIQAATRTANAMKSIMEMKAMGRNIKEENIFRAHRIVQKSGLEMPENIAAQYPF